MAECVILRQLAQNYWKYQMIRCHIQRLVYGCVYAFIGANWAMAQSTSPSTYGTPGLIDMPTAEVLGDGELALTTNKFGATSRNTLTFQMLPRVYGSFRYAIIDDFDRAVGNRYDRSFDLHVQLMTEGQNRPALSFGLRDFGGTGIYSSEYVVATKTIASRFQVTGGLGWGRMAGRNSFASPLTIFGDRFETRPNPNAGGIATTGQLDFGAWFRGPVSPFGGVKWQANERLSLSAEYSPDLYTAETARVQTEINTPLNFGMDYRFQNGGTLSAFVIGGSEVGLQYSYVLNPAQRRSPGGVDPAPTPIAPRNQVAAASWNVDPQSTPIDAVLRQRLDDEGMILQGATLGVTEARIRVQNDLWETEAQAAGRTARVMANTLPPSIETLTIVFQQAGVPLSTVTLRRTDLEELEGDYDGAWKSQTRATIEDGSDLGRAGELSGTFPTFDYSLIPYTAFSFFDPDSPLRYDVGAQLNAAYRPAPGLTFAGVFRYPVAGNIADATRQSNSVIQKVRSDSVLYAQESDLEINVLTTEYMFRPGENLFGRITAGYLENMYGGVSAEALWFPIDSRFALGAELNYVKQRDFDMLFGFQDYEVLTGHASAYYDLGNGFQTQLDVGRYLAGDLGGTLALTREFNNGFRVGGYFTLTDVSFDDFGEGSFDKGVRIEIPVSWFTGESGRDVITQVIQPVLRDGGARLNVENRLYGVARDYRGQELRDGWGRFFR